MPNLEAAPNSYLVYGDDLTTSHISLFSHELITEVPLAIFLLNAGVSGGVDLCISVDAVRVHLSAAN